MADPGNTRLRRTVERFSELCSYLVVVFGLVTLSGWAFHIPRLKSVLPGQVTVKANTAACFVLIGLALWLVRRREMSANYRRNRASQLLALTVSVVGLLSLLEAWKGWDLGIDQLLFHAGVEDIPGSIRPGLMSPITGFGFCFLGAAVMLLHSHRRWIQFLVQSLCTAVALASIFGLLDFVLDAARTHTYIAPTTAAALFLFSFAIIFSRTDSYLGALFVSSGLGGEMVQRLLPVAIIVPIIVGWLRWKGEYTGLYSEWTGVAIMTCSCITLLGAATIWTALLIDESDQQRTQAAKSVEQLAAIVTSSNNAIISKTLNGIITHWNAGAVAIYGYSAPEMLGKSVEIVIPADRRPEFQAIMQRVAGGTTVDQYETIRVRKDGRVVDVSISVSPLKDERGKIIGASTIAHDISERKRVEMALNLSEKRYRSLVIATAQIVWTTNTAGEVVDDMPMWRRFTGMSVEQIKGSGWLHSLHPDDRQRTAAVWSRAVQERSLYDTEYRIRRHDGEYRNVSVRGVPVLESDGNIREWIGTCTDITERKRAEEEVVRLNQELEQRVLQRTAELEAAIQELEAFTYSVSHDLRAPLRHINGFSKILSEEFAAYLPEEAQHHVQRIEDETRRMGMLVDDLLNLTRIGRSNIALQVTGLKAVVQEVITSLAPDMADREIEWKIGELPYVECDTALMKQVFQNLLANALKFTRPRKRAIIEIGQMEKDGVVVIYVHDNGVGFSMKYADKLFGVFERLHRSEDFEGTGVGLATVQRIIHKHGGRIWAEAELDKGATFYFTIGGAGSHELKANAAVSGVRT